MVTAIQPGPHGKTLSPQQGGSAVTTSTFIR
jgi:hypothetical protein